MFSKIVFHIILVSMFFFPVYGEDLSVLAEKSTLSPEATRFIRESEEDNKIADQEFIMSFEESTRLDVASEFFTESPDANSGTVGIFDNENN